VDSDTVCNFERPEFVTLCYDCEHVVCSVNDHFSINSSCKLIVKAREVDSDIVCILERPEFVTLCYDCEHV
jgi:hypothetical protein